ncbi:MAG: hypothetical protein ACYTEQ_20165 [Planctomycetota bacterium]|jgi:V/A-type H+-transporting ATPase subunit G/H
MELIKKIKQTEAEAQEIVERAKAEAATRAEQRRKSRSQVLEQAEQQRKKTIEAAVARAESEGLAEVQQLKAKAEKDRRLLRDKVNPRIGPGVARVMDYLKG